MIGTMKDNLPLELYKKHEATLALPSPVFFETDADLFRSGEPAESAVVFLPKSRALIDMTLALVSGRVAKGGTVVLAGSNDAGIRSAKDAFEKNVGPVSQKIVGNHSALYVGTNERRGADKTLKDYLSFAKISFGGTDIEAAVLPGVFSAGELDAGTELLLSHIPYDKASVLDVGCGAGVIGAFYEKKNPNAAVTMSDVSTIAVEAAKETAAKNRVGARAVLADGFEGIQGSFDLIVSNPPFHKGVGTDYSFIEKFAAGAKAHLKHGGEAYIVANSFLAYEEKLKKSFKEVEAVIDDGKFKVLRCR